MINEIELIDKSELARRLHLHPNTIARKEKEGVIKGIAIGTGTVRYDFQEILNDLKAADPRARLKKR
jgi:hypothetical protein